jgi:hypothetical protein
VTRPTVGSLLTATFAVLTVITGAAGLSWFIAPAWTRLTAHAIAGRLGRGESARIVALACEDEDARREWLRRAADHDDAEACFLLAESLIDRMDEQSARSVEARDLYLRAAERGHAVAMQRLGNALLLGYGGVVETSEGLRWLHAAAKAANERDAYCPLELSEQVPAREDELGITWWADPMTTLGGLHESGHLVTKDEAAAAAWYREAIAWDGRLLERRAMLDAAEHRLTLLLARRPDLRRPGDPPPRGG